MTNPEPTPEPPGWGEGALRRLREKEPRSVGPYRVFAVLGRGGMGKVYEVVKESMPGRRRALKVLSLPPRADGSPLPPEMGEWFHRRFLDEARHLALLHHPGIVEYIDFDIDPQVGPYLVMDLVVPGTPLVQHCVETGNLRTSIECFLDLLSALESLHARSIIHLDLKPRNVLMFGAGPGARPRILDFGIAQRLAPPASAPTTATSGAAAPSTALGIQCAPKAEALSGARGTPRYASPEQMLDGAAACHVGSDFHAVGVMLAEVLVGLSLRRDPDQAPVIPHDLAPVLARCVHPDIDLRYGNCAQLRGDLRAFLDDRPIESRRRDLPHVARLLVRRHRTAATLMLVLLLLGASLMGYLARGQRLQAKESDLAETTVRLEKTTGQLGRTAAERALAEGRSHVSFGRWEQALRCYDDAQREGYPDLVELDIGRIAALQGQGKDREARQLCDRLMALSELDQGAHRAKILLLHGDRGRETTDVRQLDRYRDYVEQALRLAETTGIPETAFSRADRHYADALLATDASRARLALAAALAEDSRHLPANETWISLLLLHGGGEQALADAELMRGMTPDSPAAQAAWLACRLLHGLESLAELAPRCPALDDATIEAFAIVSSIRDFLDEALEFQNELMLTGIVGDPVRREELRWRGTLSVMARSALLGVHARPEAALTRVFRLPPALLRDYASLILNAAIGLTSLPNSSAAQEAVLRRTEGDTARDAFFDFARCYCARLQGDEAATLEAGRRATHGSSVFLSQRSRLIIGLFVTARSPLADDPVAAERLVDEFLFTQPPPDEFTSRCLRRIGETVCRPGYSSALRLRLDLANGR